MNSVASTAFGYLSYKPLWSHHTNVNTWNNRIIKTNTTRVTYRRLLFPDLNILALSFTEMVPDFFMWGRRKYLLDLANCIPKHKVKHVENIKKQHVKVNGCSRQAILYYPSPQRSEDWKISRPQKVPWSPVSKFYVCAIQSFRTILKRGRIPHDNIKATRMLLIQSCRLEP